MRPLPTQGCPEAVGGRLAEQPAFSARLRRRGQVVTVREGRSGPVGMNAAKR
jgi:hypothetical protein